MKQKRSSRSHAGYLALIFLAILGCAEIGLRLCVPLTSLVGQDIAPKVWLLDNLDSLPELGSHPRQVSDADLGWTLGKGVREPRYSTNSQGFRGQREYSTERATGIQRGMVLGDSFSEGYGVADDETYSAQMEKILPNTEVLNLAVSAYGVDQAVLRWEKVGRPYSPDFIVLGIYIDDFHRNVLTWRFACPKPRFYVVDGKLELSHYALPPIEDRAGNVRRLRTEFAGLLWTPRVWIAGEYACRRVAQKLRGHREPDETFLEKSKILELLIQRLASDCKQRDVRLILVSIQDEYIPYPDEARILAVITEACKEQGVPLLPLERYLGSPSASPASEPIFDQATRHWSTRGHRLAAEKIVEFLRELKIVE